MRRPLPQPPIPLLQGALKDGFGEAVVARDMPEPCKFPSLDSCQKRFLWTNNGVDPPPRPVVGLVLQVEDAEKFPQTLGFDTLDPFFRIGKQGPCSTAIEVTRDLYELNLLAKLMVLLRQILFNPAIAVIAARQS